MTHEQFAAEGYAIYLTTLTVSQLNRRLAMPGVKAELARRKAR